MNCCNCKAALSPIPATDAMTQPVGQRDGQLYTLPGGGIIPVPATPGMTQVVGLRDGKLYTLPFTVVYTDDNIWSGRQQFNEDVSIAVADISNLLVINLRDSENQPGNNGDVLTATPDGVKWMLPAHTVKTDDGVTFYVDVTEDPNFEHITKAYFNPPFEPIEDTPVVYRKITPTARPFYHIYSIRVPINAGDTIPAHIPLNIDTIVGEGAVIVGVSGMFGFSYNDGYVKNLWVPYGFPGFYLNCNDQYGEIFDELALDFTSVFRSTASNFHGDLIIDFIKT